MAVASAGPYASLHLAPDRKPHQHPTTLFLQAGWPSCRPTNSVNALKVKVKSKAIGYFSFHSFKNIRDDLSSLDLGIHEARDLA